jgi:hypothetical protein
LGKRKPGRIASEAVGYPSMPDLLFDLDPQKPDVLFERYLQIHDASCPLVCTRPERARAATALAPALVAGLRQVVTATIHAA